MAHKSWGIEKSNEDFGQTLGVYGAGPGPYLVLPFLDPILAGLVTGALVFGYRFIVVDKDKRLLRESFAVYLPPAEIERMMTSQKLVAFSTAPRNFSVEMYLPRRMPSISA